MLWKYELSLMTGEWKAQNVDWYFVSCSSVQ